jgi:hypothetical protein
VRRGTPCGTPTAMTPHQFNISAEGEDLRKSRSPGVRNACDAFICSVFRYLADQLTVFVGAGIARNYLPSDLPSKSFAWGRKVKIMAQHQPWFFKDLRVQAIDRDRCRGPFHSPSIINEPSKS